MGFRVAFLWNNARHEVGSGFIFSLARAHEKLPCHQFLTHDPTRRAVQTQLAALGLLLYSTMLHILQVLLMNKPTNSVEFTDPAISVISCSLPRSLQYWSQYSLCLEFELLLEGNYNTNARTQTTAYTLLSIQPGLRHLQLKELLVTDLASGLPQQVQLSTDTSAFP